MTVVSIKPLDVKEMRLQYRQGRFELYHRHSLEHWYYVSGVTGSSFPALTRVPIEEAEMLDSMYEKYLKESSHD